MLAEMNHSWAGICSEFRMYCKALFTPSENEGESDITLKVYRCFILNYSHQADEYSTMKLIYTRRDRGQKPGGVEGSHPQKSKVYKVYSLQSLSNN